MQNGNDVPCDVSKCSEMQVAHDAQRLLLLSVIDVDCILSSNRVDHAVTQRARVTQPVQGMVHW